MWKKSRDSASIETTLNLVQTASMIDLLKEVPFLDLDFYGKASLTKKQDDELQEKIVEAQTNFFSKHYNVSPGGVYIGSSHGDFNKGFTKRNIHLFPDFLSGKEIVKVGFSNMYGWAKGVKYEDRSRKFSSLQIKREKNQGRKYRLKIEDVFCSWAVSPVEKDRERAEKYRSRLISLVEREMKCI